MGGPACLMVFLMKFFGWDYQRCYKTIIKKRPMARFTKLHDKAIHAYHAELSRLKLAIDRGQSAESNLISHFQSSMKPFFLKSLAMYMKPKVAEHSGEAEITEPEVETVGGENVTPRQNNYVDENGKPVDPTPYKKHTYQGTDEFVRAKLGNRSQGIKQIKKAQSMLRLRKDMPAEEVIGSFQNSRHGQSWRNRDSEMMR